MKVLSRVCCCLCACIPAAMGGHNAGELASRTAVETLKSALEDIESGHRAYKNIFSLSDTGCRLMSAIRAANSRILQLAQTNPDFNGMIVKVRIIPKSPENEVVSRIGRSPLASSSMRGKALATPRK